MAVNLTAAQLKAAVASLDDDTEAARLLAVVSALVEREGPDAPEVIQNEAIIRAAAWLHQSRVTIGLQTVEQRSHTASCIGASGARALLEPWRVPFIGGDDD